MSLEDRSEILRSREKLDGASAMYESTLTREDQNAHLSRTTGEWLLRSRHGNQRTYTTDKPKDTDKTNRGNTMGRSIWEYNRRRHNHDCHNVSAIHGTQD